MKVEEWNIAEDLFSEDPAHVLAAARVMYHHRIALSDRNQPAGRLTDQWAQLQVHKCQIGVAQLTKLHKAPKVRTLLLRYVYLPSMPHAGIIV